MSEEKKTLLPVVDGIVGRRESRGLVPGVVVLRGLGHNKKDELYTLALAIMLPQSKPSQRSRPRAMAVFVLRSSSSSPSGGKILLCGGASLLSVDTTLSTFFHAVEMPLIVEAGCPILGSK